MLRTEIINGLIEFNKYQSYLEIGIGDGVNYDNVVCAMKSNVDPGIECHSYEIKQKIVNVATSDEFFQKNTEKFDIIFIDGFHEYTQVYRDVKNSLKILNPGGCILCHDMLPPSEWHQRPASEYNGFQEWNGDCWKAVARLRVEEENLEIYTIDTDWGVSVIREGRNDKYVASIDEALTYAFFETHKKELMNVVSTYEFIENKL